MIKKLMYYSNLEFALVLSMSLFAKYVRSECPSRMRVSTRRIAVPDSSQNDGPLATPGDARDQVEDLCARGCACALHVIMRGEISLNEGISGVVDEDNSVHYTHGQNKPKSSTRKSMTMSWSSMFSSFPAMRRLRTAQCPVTYRS